MRNSLRFGFDLQTHQNPRLRPILNPPFLLITRTKSGFYAEFGPNMQESCFWPKVSVFLGPSRFSPKIAIFLAANPLVVAPSFHRTR